MMETTNPTPEGTPLPVVLDRTQPKPGYMTTEFWLKVAALVLTALYASGVIPTSGTAAAVAAIAATMLGALGYTVSRTWAKNASVTLLLFAIGGAAATQVACSSADRSAALKTGIGDVVDCTTADRQKLYDQFGPTMEQAITRATDASGHVDLPSLKSITASLREDGWCVVKRAAAQLIAAALGKSGAASANAPLDAGDLSGQLDRLQASRFGATRFELGAAP